VTALVGASGGGKTSILRLLLRMYEASEPPPPTAGAAAAGLAPEGVAADAARKLATVEGGECTADAGSCSANTNTDADADAAVASSTDACICIDGVPLSRWSLYDLRRQVAYVDQESTLLNRSIRDNLTLGLSDAERPADDAIAAACRAAHIYETIAGFPEGFDTVVGERGVRLSAGERQRVAIARAFLRDPAIVLLDEVTANLDALSEAAVREGLRELMRGRTVITVAHRLSMAMAADQILVVEGGRIREAGTVPQLLAPGSGSRFAQLVACQALWPDLQAGSEGRGNRDGVGGDGAPPTGDGRRSPGAAGTHANAASTSRAYPGEAGDVSAQPQLQLPVVSS
jgi:ABC-type transport system involved in cytochrome bd biosynthesis fused ATPase/permease subunit